MTDVRTEAIPLVDGSTLRLTVAAPVSSIRGGIVVLHEARGVTDAVRGLVHGLAGEGWLVVAPHLYHRDTADEREGDDGQVQQQVERLDGEQVMADTDTAFDIAPTQRKNGPDSATASACSPPSAYRPR